MNTSVKWFLLKVFVGVTLFGFFVRLFLFENFKILSSTMFPTLLSGDIVMVSKLDYGIQLPFSAYELLRFRTPKRGDVIAFYTPDQIHRTHIKRVLGLEGEKVEIKNSKLFINNEIVQGPEISQSIVEKSSPQGPQPGENNQASTDKILEKFGPVDVPKHHFFALSDNRNDLNDSRTLGPIPYSCIKGKVRLVLLSKNPDDRNLRKGRFGLVVQ